MNYNVFIPLFENSIVVLQKKLGSQSLFSFYKQFNVWLIFDFIPGDKGAN